MPAAGLESDERLKADGQTSWKGLRAKVLGETGPHGQAEGRGGGGSHLEVPRITRGDRFAGAPQAFPGPNQLKNSWKTEGK